jgi:L-rhamnose mutarotase
MFFMQISKHSPETCPTYNEHTRKNTIDIFQNMESMLKKHGVKLAGMWNDHPGHIVYNIYEAPNMESFMGLMMEPMMQGWLAYNTVEIKPIFGPEEIKVMFGLK